MVNKMVTKMVPHYGLRKLSVGVASVLLGTTIYGYNVAHADTLSVGNTNENENADAGGQMPYQEGKNVNALNDNGQQANNQENVVNDQQTPYADSLAVLDLNNNYQKNSLATLVPQNKDGSVQTVNNNENNNAVNKSEFNTSDAISNSQSYWQQNALQSNLVQTRKVRPADSVDPKGWSVRPLVYGAGNSSPAVYGTNLALNYNISILDGSGWLYDHTDSTVTVVPGGYKVPILNGNTYRGSNGNTYVESLVYLWKNQDDYGNDYPDAYAYILTDSKPMHETGWSGDDTRLVVIADPAGNIISDLSGELRHPIESMRPKILSSVNYQIDYIDNVTGKVIKSQKVSEVGSGVHNISYTIPSGYRIAGSNDYPTVVTSDNGILKFDGNVLNRHVTQGSVIPVKITKSNTANLTSTEVKLHQGIWLNQDVFAKTHPTIVVNSDNATDKGELVTSYDGVEKYALDSDAAGRVKQIQIDGTGLVASVTFQGNLGNLVDESGNKLTAINKVVRDYYSLEPGGRLAIYKESENMFGFAHSPFYLNGFLYAGAKAIRIVTHYYDANGNELHIPINSDVLPLALSGMHTYSGTVNGVLLDSSNKSNLASNQSVNVKTSSDGLTLISSRPGDHYSWKPVGASGTSQGDGYIIGAFDLSTGKPSVGNSNNLGYVSLAQPYQIQMNDTQNMQMVHSVRRIHFVDSNGNKVHDDVTQNISWLKIFQNGRQLNSLQDKSFSSMATPTLKGYMPSVDVIPAETVSPSSLVNEDYTVTYSLASVIKVKLVKLIPDELNTNDAYALNPKNNMHEHKNVNDNGGFDKDYWGTVDPTCWNYTVRGDVISLDGLKSGDSQHVIIPNIADFQAKGIDHGAKKVTISSNVMRNVARNALTIGLSKTDNQKVIAKDSDWRNVFHRETSYANESQGKLNSGLTRMDLHNFDTGNIVNMSGMFANRINSSSLNSADTLESIGDLSEWNVSNVTNMSFLFDTCSLISDLGNLNSWNTSNVTDMSQMFCNMDSLVNLGDLSHWNVGKVKSIRSMFIFDGHLTSIGNLDNWDVSNMSDLSCAFQSTSSLSSLGDLSRWDTSHFSNINYTFGFMPSLKTLNISNWDLSSVSNQYTPFDSTFSYDSNLILIANNLKLPSWFPNEKSEMFSDHMAVITNNVKLLKLTNNVDSYTIDGNKFTRPIFYSSKGSSDAKKVLESFNDQFRADYQSKHPDTSLNYVYSPDYDKPINLANPSFQGEFYMAAAKVMYVYPDGTDSGNGFVAMGPNTHELDNTEDHIKESLPKGYIVDGSIPKIVYGHEYKIKIKPSQTPITDVSELNATITVTYKFNVIDKYASDPRFKTQTQILHFKRTGYVDGVTGQKVFTDWQAIDSAKAVTVPKLTGYDWDTGSSRDKEGHYTSSLDPKDVNAVALDFVRDKNGNDSITYSINAVPEHCNQEIDFVDSDGNNHTMTVVEDFYDTVLNVNEHMPEMPDGWRIVPGQNIPKTVTMSFNGKPIKIRIEHIVNPVKPGEHGVPAQAFEANPKRTIIFNVPGEYADKPQYKKIVQTVHFTRNITYDEVTKQVIYGPWKEKGNFSEVNVPELAGYKTSMPVISEMAVTGDTKDITISVGYVAEKQSQLINYVDTATSKTIHQQMVNGVTDQTVNVANEIPANWKLADDQTLPSSITLTNNPSLLTVKITHVINPANPSLDGPFPAGTQKSDWYRTVKHFVNFEVPSKYADNPLYKQIVQTINFSRKGQIDAVTGKITYFGWQQDNKFMNVTVPGLDGYTSSQTTVIAPAVNADSKDIVTDVTYMATPSSVRISYVDNDNREISHQDFSGVTDQDVNINAQLPANWKLASGQQVPEVITLLARPRTIQVVVEHIVNNVRPGENGPWPGNTQKSDWYRTVTRTISFKVPDKYSSQSQFKTIVQTVNFKRSGHLDTVINKVTFDAWQRTGQFDVVKVPGLTGYTTNYVTVDQVVPGADDQDSVVDVTYTPKAESQLINYVDANGQVIHRQKVDGKMDDTIKVIPDIPAHWKLSNGVSVPGTITLTDQPSALSYQIEHIIDNLTPSENGPYPHDTKKSDWFRTVTRAINFTVPDKYDKEPQFKTITQMVNFKRTGHYDQALDKVSFDPWQRAGQFDAVKVPQLFGYTTSTDQVVGEVPTENSSNQTANVTYAPQTATLWINFVTPDGQQVGHVDDKGVFDTVIDLGINWRNDLPSGYQIYDRNIDQDLGSLSIDFLTKTINVMVVPTQTMKTQTKTVTRRIHLQMPNGAEQVVTQSAVFTRKLTMQTGSKDPVEVGAWSPDAWLVAYQPSHLDGYTIDNVKSVLVSGDSNDQDVYLKYQAIAQPTTVTFALINGQIVDSVKVDDLKTAQVSNLVPKGYHLLNSEDGASRLLVEPDMVTYNGNMSNVPSNVGELKRTVKRTIIMTLANGRTRRIVQQVRFTRTATVNQATGEIMYGDWHAVGSSKFNRINVPKRVGKTIRILGGNVNAVAVNANMHDSVVRVRYI